MPCRCHIWVLLTQFNGQFRIALQADAPAVFRQVEQCKHLPDHFKDQGCIVEWESFGDGGFGDAVFANFFYVQIFGFRYEI